ncbi:Na+/H+ antiporter subunit C [Haliangium ochraceum]|uniref:NADH-ubiquinone oxidoreductase chain 4L n=1 Tax=Haliangium ochraceum (strain DSM 14365 / JCM 11303 / SMP-2) TaxID=502025 RepID=D0LWA3_HALO1|nr:Na+/H+ antiporter subunit C [Haliangium ochraceum]ACY16035.1 NADH-ubiquinone oxidoreductase chain 4L [Haliangium ochraceum DSM 14365]
MFIVLSLTVGVLFATGVYLILRRSVARLVFGLIVLGHGANLLIFTAGGLRAASPPLVGAGMEAPPSGHADPVPQALILTAIVIGFAVVAFAAVLVKRVYATLGSDDLDAVHYDAVGGSQ